MLNWDEEIIFNDGDSFFNDLFESISNAKKTINIESYIFDLDVLGLKLLNSLSAAAERGVIVKLLIDGAGCSEWNFSDAEKFRKNNFQIRFFHPLTWQRKHSRLWTFLSINKIIRGLSLFNHRNHRKVFLVDEHAYVGSMNVTSKHLKSVYHQQAWRDTVVRLRGEKIHVLYETFNEAWRFYNNYILRYLQKITASSGMPLIMLNRTIKQRRHTYHCLIQRLLSAKTKIYITTPYFIPTLRMRRILKKAAENGVEVVAILPRKNDFIGVKLAMNGFYSSLLKSGIKIFEYQPSMLHAKVLITDHRVMIGSTNMNSRSLLLDLEVDIEITHSDNIKLIQSQFKEDLSQCKEIYLNEWNQRSLYEKFLEKIFFWFRLVL